MSTESEPFWFLRPGLVLPTPAVLAVLALERAGHQLRLDPEGDAILIEQARGVDLDPQDLDQLRRWKQNAILFLNYCASDVAMQAWHNVSTEQAVA